MDELINKITNYKNSGIGQIVDSRIKEFKEIGKKSNDEIFKEMCFCILTANFDAEKCIKIQKNIGKYFLIDNKDELSKKLKNQGYRFPNIRADYISSSLECKNRLENKIQLLKDNELREWIVKNVKGLGYKEASHFLRNIGFDDFAIIDFHIINILVNHKLIKRPKTLTKRKYLEIEHILRNLASRTGLSLAELDLYLWYIETGKILK
jgi:N-glycosylase/DNA lyase